MISSLTTDGGRPYYWDAATECQAQADGAMPAYSTSIHRYRLIDEN